MIVWRWYHRPPPRASPPSIMKKANWKIGCLKRSLASCCEERANRQRRYQFLSVNVCGLRENWLRLFTLGTRGRRRTLDFLLKCRLSISRTRLETKRREEELADRGGWKVIGRKIREAVTFKVSRVGVDCETKVEEFASFNTRENLGKSRIDIVKICEQKSREKINKEVVRGTRRIISKTSERIASRREIRKITRQD